MPSTISEDMLRAGERELVRQYQESSWEEAKDVAETAQVDLIYRAMAAAAAKPIATAPSSGRFLVYGGECSCDVRPDETWPNEGWCAVERTGEDFAAVNSCHYGVRILGATHWMPEPGKPAA